MKRFPLVLQGVLALGLFMLYLATLTQVHTFDALSYVTSVERKPWNEVFHPHHLAYGPLGTLTLAIAQALGYTGGAALPMQLLNAVAGAFGVALFFAVVRQVTGRNDLAFVAALLLGGSYAYWYYAVEIEVYTVAALLLIGCLFLMALPGPPALSRLVALGVVQAGAILFHQTNVLLCVPVAVWLVGHWRGLERGAARWILRSGLCYALVLGLCVGVPYLVVGFGVSGFRSLDAFVVWMTEYARTGWWGGPLTETKLAGLATGLSETLAQPGGGWLWLALGVVVGVGQLRTTPASWPVGAACGPHGMAAVLLSWLLVYGAFFFWWEPDNIEFWIASLPPLFLLFALALRHTRAWGIVVWVGVVIAAITLGVNADSIRRRGDAATDLQRLIASELARNSTPADLLLIPDGLLELYLPYYEGHEQFVSLNQALFDSGGDWNSACGLVQSRIATAQHAGATALIADDVLHPPLLLIERHRLHQEQVDACFAPYQQALIQLAPVPNMPVYFRLPTGQERADGDGWRFAAFAEGWQAANIGEERFGEGWQFAPGIDPSLTSPLLHLDAGRYKALEIRLVNGTQARDAQLFFSGPDGQIDERRSVRWALEPTTEAVTYTIELDGAPGWEGVIARLRFDPVGVGDGGEMRIEAIRLVRA